VVEEAGRRAAAYLAGVDARPVAPTSAALARLGELGGPLPAGSCDPTDVLRLLDEVGSPATTATAGGRFFGFVVGGALPAAAGANVLAAAWDQNAGMVGPSPVGAHLEEVALAWLLEVLRLPDGCAAGFVSGATMANFSGLAAARHELLARKGWDVEARGLFGAPEIRVIVGDEVHVSVLKALTLLGLGHERVTRVPTDDQGRMRPEAFPELAEPALVCLQAGNVNTGAFDPAAEVCALARRSESWVHVDGAFGLWARAAEPYASLAAGLELADSWALDAHKWLNVPYDSGIAFCKHPESMARALTFDAAYLVVDEQRVPSHFTPEMSRRARGVEVWAALRSLGRSGVTELIDRCCRHARRLAAGLAAAGYEILNEVCLNQVLVDFGGPERTDAVIAAILADGTCWCSGTTWHGRRAMRISVSSWATTDEDIELSLGSILRLAGD